MAKPKPEPQFLTWRNETRRLSELVPWDRNPRQIKDAEAKRLGESLLQFGQVQTIAVGPNGEIYDGHQRALVWSLLQEGGDREVDVRVSSRALTEKEREKLVVYLHRGATGEWDFEALANGFNFDDLVEWGFSESELVGFDFGNSESAGEDPGADLDKAAELQAKWQVKTGDLWIMKDHRLICGDCTDPAVVARVMGGEKARIIVTSPPYNQNLDQFRPSGMHTETRWVSNVQHGSYADSKPESEYQSEQIKAINIWKQFLTDDGSLFYNHKPRYRNKQVINPWIWISKTNAKVRQEIIWKREGSVTQNARMFMPCDERIFWMYWSNDFYFNDTTEHKTFSSVWEINSHKDIEISLHGCAFPLELAERPIKACSDTHDICIEPYCGSGTTLIACERLNRRCRAIEIEPKYVAVALERWSVMTGQTPVLEKAS